MNIRKGLSSEHGKYELKMTPMIDVVFLLLIFFMVTMKFRTPEGKIRSDLPQDTVEVSAEDIEQINIIAKRVGDETEILINQESYGLDFARVEKRLREIRERSERMDLPHIFIIDGSQNVRFQYVVTTINTCVRAGIADLSFAPPPSSAF